MKRKKRRRRNVCRKSVAIRNGRNGRNRHHIFYQKRFWDRNRWSRALRDHQFCIVEMPISEHNVIHARLFNMPIPSEFICKLVVEKIDELWSFGAIGEDTPIQIRLDTLICLLDCVATDTANALKEQKNILNKLKKPH